ncbi:hypothetical protein DTO166G5_7387 [Paecilomyces variotii]|nr:hypothetical protein DTO166G5_7387 [Paecilomyces variotii]KAJ9307907.1 hypothetical protein DTO217A2_2663 [Paecilomyces variotii]KAJ9320185.1 hypothetical protein DTO027B3_8781 [Paecilomyces variotii]KAJ9373605.1 hypothetical protein DTO282E5_1760 [Paecilomyces variotii]KAJ9400345.1 hypothetical protein DTO282F9_2813 [Paecilomyces variotii]
MHRVAYLSSIFALTCSAREIVFPPVAGIAGNSHQVPFELTETVDIVTGSQFSGLTTFAHLPYVNCFVDTEAENNTYDIAFLGAPFDTGVTARPGARYGPGGIRLGSRRMGGWSIFTGVNPFDDWAKVVDCGDAPLTFLDNTVALQQLDLAHKVISSRPATASNTSPVPRIITLGGDHTTTLSALRSTYEKWGPVSVVHFDSHIDTWNPEVLGGGISHYAGVNHGTFLHIAHEEGLISNSSLHVGIRAPMIRRKGDVRNDIRCGFQILTARDIDRFGVDGMVEKIRNRVGHNRVYISVDIDVLDPSYAPATGTAEPGGFTTRELLSILDGLSGLPVIGADVVEVAPIYDTAGETTTLAAAEVARSLLTLMIEEPVIP